VSLVCRQKDICLVHSVPHPPDFSAQQPVPADHSGTRSSEAARTRRTSVGCRMIRDAQLSVAAVDSALSSAPGTPLPRRIPIASSRMQYRRRPVSVAVDPVSLVISECIAITSAIQKHARSPYSSVSAILGGSPNLVQLVPPGGPAVRRPKSLTDPNTDGASDTAANRWGLRGKKGKSMQDNPLIAGFGRLRQELTGIRGKSSQN